MGAKSSRITAQNNRSDGHLLEYFRKSFIRGGGGTNFVNLQGLTATGGVISDYTAPGPGAIYRAHIFTSSGTFSVSSIGAYGSTADIFLVGGGGSGGARHGGGGGGGGAVWIPGGSISAPSSYTVIIGAGGARTRNDVTSNGNPGSPTFFGPPSPGASGAPNGETAYGGGGGGGFVPGVGSNGGSGGGGGNPPTGGPVSGGTASQPVTNAFGTATPYGTNGGNGYYQASPDWRAGGGGGGAGGAGQNSSTSFPGGSGGDGGPGVQVGAITDGTNNYYWAGGGGGHTWSPGPGSGPAGDGGAGGAGAGGSAYGTPGAAGTGGITNATAAGSSSEGWGGDAGYSTGSGGGASAQNSFASFSGYGGAGGSGIVVVRYQIGSVQTGVARATGGAISYYGGKTIHTFTSSGTFATAPNWNAATVEYVVIGGGGSGGLKQYVSGGGGAGAYRTGTTPIGAHPVSTTIQVGAGGVVADFGPVAPPASADGTPSYFGTPITAPGGGGGGTYLPSAPGGIGRAGGSGGGGAAGVAPGVGGPAPGATPFPGTIGATPPTSWWGHVGGDSNTNVPVYGAGGGGGAGGAGGNGSPTAAGVGGAGIQLPSTFRNPTSTVGAPGPTSAPTPNGFDTSGKYWVAGGGAGSSYPTGTTPGSGGGPGGPYAGGGAGGAGNNGGDGGVNTGGGGGGQERETGPATQAGRGGSGIVLIAYPS